MNAYKVGGCIRDRLLGLPVRDNDWVVTGATTGEMLDAGFMQVGKDFPVFLHPETKEEYALARTERKSGPGYTGFEVFASPAITLEDDLLRRDLTINAMAETEDGQLIDPHGGRKDLEDRLLRHVSPAFSEDPVRILRVARLAARYADLGFTVAPETGGLMREMIGNGEVDALVPERVWQETVHALAENTPVRFFEVLRECGALGRLFPEIDRLFGVPQSEVHHPEIDTGVHTMMVLEQAASMTPDTRVRFAALVHDLGKGTTRPDELPQHIAHEARSVKLVTQLCRRLKAPNDYRGLAEIVARYHTHCHRARELKPATIHDTLVSVGAFHRTERFDQFLVACEADARGRKGLEERPYPQAEYLRQAREAATSVDTTPYHDTEMSGQEIGERLRTERIAKIKAFRLGWKW